MLLALVGSVRVAARRGLVGRCPTCGGEVVAKVGNLVSAHWAHKSNRDCDSWAEMGEWHIGWQSRFPVEWCEVPIGEHRADVQLPGGVVVEFQHSPLSVPDIRAREQHYGSLVWVFNAVDAYRDDRLALYGANGLDDSRRRSFRWKHPRRSVMACTRQVFLDLGDGWLLKVGVVGDGFRGSGYLVSYDEFVRQACHDSGLLAEVAQRSAQPRQWASGEERAALELLRDELGARPVELLRISPPMTSRTCPHRWAL